MSLQDSNESITVTLSEDREQLKKTVWELRKKVAENERTLQAKKAELTAATREVEGLRVSCELRVLL